MQVEQLKCETCLSSDRQLLCLSKLKSIIYEIHLPQLLTRDGGVCWECHSNMVKIHKFRKQVQTAQEILSTGSQQIKSLSTLSRNTKRNYDFEYTFNYDPLTNINAAVTEKQVKDEPKNIKLEDENNDFDDRMNSDTDFDDKPLSKVFADRIKIKTVARERKRLHKKRSLKQDKKKIKSILQKNMNLKKEPTIKNKTYLKKEHQSKDNLECLKIDKSSEITEILKEKFETIIFNEEEMLKCREEKRNQANFKKIPYKCSSCVTGFTKKENYELHLKKIHDESIGSYTCAVCEAKFATQTGETRHRSRHYLQYKCTLCDYKVSSVTAAVAHARRKHAADSAGSIHCKLCAFLARTSEELSEHTKDVHSLVCNECGVKFKGRNTLRSHKIRIHSVKREFSCDTCFKTFTSKSRLESHSTRHSNVAAYCTHCKVQYKDIHVYRNHLRNNKNHVQDRISCPVCNKKFASRVYFTKHYNFYHLRRSQYKCEDCDKIFISEWRLKIHKQTNHGLARTREHACNVCAKTFYTKATLLTHSLLHTATRAFMCATCGATFRQRAALYTHARLLHRTSAQKLVP